LREHEDELTQVLRDSVPGLVHGSSEASVQATLSVVGTDDRMLGTNQHHRLLVRPDAFHVSVLFQPTLAFLDRVADVLPSGLESARASSTVLDEFVLRVYLPQLEDKVSLLFHQALSGMQLALLQSNRTLTSGTTGPEAFQPDPASIRFSTQPLAKVSLIKLLPSMLTGTGRNTIDGPRQFALCDA
jgi:exocyst complex component 4